MKREQFEAHCRAEKSHWWFRARRRILMDIVRELVPPNCGNLVVDVGCGTGGNVAALWGEYEAIGLDLSELTIKLAREHSPQAEFLVGTGPDAIADRIEDATLFLCTDVLEHIEFERDFLREWVEAAPSGSYFLMTVPADMALWSPHDVSHSHFRRYDMQGWLQVWQDMPLITLMASYFNTTLYPIVRLLRTLTRLRGKSLGEADTDLTVPWGPINKTLEWLFARERHRLLNLLADPRQKGFGYGVSLISVLRKP